MFVKLLSMINERLCSIKQNNRDCLMATIVFAAIVFYQSWVCDDAYHAFIMARNLVEGNGFVYNLGYRVNASTSPFFTLLVAIIYFLTNDMYLSGILLGTIFSAGTVLLLFKYVCKNRIEIVLLMIWLLSCYSFMSFTTSGLENSALFFLITCIAIIYFKIKDYTLKHLFALTFFFSVLLVMRMDNALIVFPMLVYAFAKCRCNLGKRFLMLLLGIIPFAVWELFSVWYYGFPFPNTAYAKLSTGFDISEYLSRGVDYLWRSLLSDLVLLVTLLAFAVLVFRKKKSKICVSAIGVFLYYCYVVYIGGDFMAGRHLTCCFLLNCIILLFNYSKPIIVSAVKIGGFFCLIGLLLIYISYQSIINHSCFYTKDYLCHSQTSITDEKWYYKKFDIYDYLIEKYFFDKDLLYAYKYDLISYLGTNIIAIDNKKVLIDLLVPGMGAYYLKVKDSNLMVVDSIGLSDEFLSRLPALQNKWRVGHILRAFPKGYIATLLYDKNMIFDRELHNYYDIMHNVVTGELFDFNRILSIIELNTTEYNLLRSLKYHIEDNELNRFLSGMCLE